MHTKAMYPYPSSSVIVCTVLPAVYVYCPQLWYPSHRLITWKEGKEFDVYHWHKSCSRNKYSEPSATIEFEEFGPDVLEEIEEQAQKMGINRSEYIGLLVDQKVNI